MKKTNFLKGLALAVLVSSFATSCSEEELSIQNGSIKVPEYTLPAATASVTVSVVDLEEGTLVGNMTTIDATAAIGDTLSIACPVNPGYTVADAIDVVIPAIKEGQAINVPVTFYVVTLESAYADLNISWTGTDWDSITDEEVALADVITKFDEGWKDNVFANATDEETFAGLEHISYDGYEFVKEITEDEVESKAVTTYEDILKHNLKFRKFTAYTHWNVPAWNALTLKGSKITYVNQMMAIKNDAGEIVYRFLVKVCWGVTFDAVLENIAPEHDNHNGHDHGNGNNAGGGSGADGE